MSQMDNMFLNACKNGQKGVVQTLLSKGEVDVNKRDAVGLTSLHFARSLFGQQGRVSAVELKLKDGTDLRQAKQDIRRLLGEDFVVQDRYEQQEDVFRIMRVEKLVAYIFLTFILVIACFNIIGSLSMLIIDKRDDMATLRNLGADDRTIVRIFSFEGRLISFIGVVAGTVLGLLLCLAQQHFGLLKMGDEAGSFIVDAYPVSVHAWDIAVIFVTVLVAGHLSTWYPVRYLSKRLL